MRKIIIILLTLLFLFLLQLNIYSIEIIFESKILLSYSAYRPEAGNALALGTKKFYLIGNSDNYGTLAIELDIGGPINYRMDQGIIINNLKYDNKKYSTIKEKVLLRIFSTKYKVTFYENEIKQEDFTDIRNTSNKYYLGLKDNFNIDFILDFNKYFPFLFIQIEPMNFQKLEYKELK